MPAVALFDVFAMSVVGDIALRCRTIGKLCCNGAIVACDPLIGEHRPFIAAFPRGMFDVEVLVACERADERVALARVCFDQARPVRFELALLADQDLRMLAPGQIFGYGVDAGTGCFAMPGAVEATDGDHLLAKLRENERPTWSWATAAPRDGGHQLVAFSSGYGDGVYPTWIGYTADGAICCLITDFGCLELELPELPDDPAFRRNRADEQHAKMTDAIVRDDRMTATLAARELAAGPDDAAHLVPLLIAAWRAAGREVQQVLRTTLTSMIRSTAVQRAVTAEFAALDEALAVDLLRGKPREVDAGFVESAWARWQSASSPLRAAILELGMVASARDGDRDSERVMARSLELLDSQDAVLLDAALASLELSSRTDLDIGAAEARVRELAVDGSAPRLRSRAFELMDNLGIELDSFLSSPDPRVRLECARAVARSRRHTPRIDAVLAALVDDRALTLEQRAAAAASIRDAAVKANAYVAVGLQGYEGAPMQLRYLGGAEAVEGLERLRREGQGVVKQQAGLCLERLGEIERQRERPRE